MRPDGRLAVCGWWGRLKDGVRVEQAQAEATGLAADFEQRYPNDKGYSLKVTTFLDREVGVESGVLSGFSRRRWDACC